MGSRSPFDEANGAAFAAVIKSAPASTIAIIPARPPYVIAVLR
jgi:hypothetical protein